MTSSLFIVQPDGVLTYLSPTTHRLLGAPPARLLGAQILDSIHPADSPGMRRLLEAMADGSEASAPLQFRMRHADGSWRSVEAIARPLAEGLPAVALIARDVSERKPVEVSLREWHEQLWHSQKMEALGRLAASITHDFGNLLTVFIGASERLLDGLPADHALRKETELIRSTASRAVAMTSQLLAFTRARSGAPADISPIELITGTEHLLRSLIGEHIELVTRCAPDVGLVRADRTLLEQVLLNLATNARDAMPGGGCLAIAAVNVDVDGAADVPPGRYVLVTVTDTGVGMSAETLARAFEPFFTTKEVGKGTGLGLATVYGIVRQSGGVVRIESNLGAGTSVHVLLPSVDAPVVPPARKVDVAAPSPGGVETLLVVEDEDAVRELVKDILETAGYRVLEASCAAEALRRCASFDSTIHLMLTDVVMPEVNGLQLANQLQAIKPEIRVVFMSGYPEHTSLPGGSIGQDMRLISKPFGRATLLQAIRRALDEVDEPT